jgi:hypothetical protein
MTKAAERFLCKAAMEIATDVPFEDVTFYKHNDWVLESELFYRGLEFPFNDGFAELIAKPAMIQRIEYGKHETLFRITKAGWLEAKRLQIEHAIKNCIPFDNSSDEDFWFSFV